MRNPNKKTTPQPMPNLNKPTHCYATHCYDEIIKAAERGIEAWNASQIEDANNSLRFWLAEAERISNSKK